MDLYLFSGIKTGISLPNGGCTSAVLKFLGIFSVNTTAAQVFNVSSGRWSIAMPGISTMPVTEISVSAAIALDDEPCGTADLVDSLSSVTGLGLTSTPRTSTVKCVLQNGELRVLSTSAVRFMVPNVTLFRDVSNSVFEEYDDLLQAMEFSINNATFQSNSTFFMEVKTSNATIDAVGCFSTKDLRQQATYLTCIYSTTNTFTTNQQTINPLITAARGQSLPPPANFSTSMTIRHLPLSYNRMARPLSISALRRATANATHYLASLGQNFYTDWDAAKLYVIYDTTDLEQGFEIPRGLFITMAVLAAASLLLWFFTGLLLGNLYTGTLYRVIAAEIAVRTENSAPMLMRSKVNPVEFEGYLLIPDDGLHELDNISNNDDNDNDKNDDNDNDKNDDTGNGNDEDKNNDRNDNSNNHSNKTPLPESLKRD
ncbi:hypothetical protein EDD21DRAFT_384251 [Dissophora ornata]|nr:hypothetical protein EDD21DRAFT_384251 [Dissophora ornata]